MSLRPSDLSAPHVLHFQQNTLKFFWFTPFYKQFTQCSSPASYITTIDVGFSAPIGSKRLELTIQQFLYTVIGVLSHCVFQVQLVVIIKHIESNGLYVQGIGDIF